jgi:hypothetical protein
MKSIQAETNAVPSGNRLCVSAPAGAAMAWPNERERILFRLCGRLKSRRAKGEPVVRAAKRLARQWRGRFYRNRPTKAVKVSGSLLLRKYYALENANWDAGVLRLRYRIPPRRVLPDQLAAEFARRCLLPGSGSGADVYRGLEADWRRGITIPGVEANGGAAERFPFSLSSFYRRVPGRAVRALRTRRATIAHALRTVRADESKLRLSPGVHEN